MERARGPYGRWVLFIHYINFLSIFWLASVKLQWLFLRRPVGLIFSSVAGSRTDGRAQSTGGLHFAVCSSLEPEEVYGIARSIRAPHCESEAAQTLVSHHKPTSGRSTHWRPPRRGSACGTGSAQAGWFSLREQVVSVMQRLGVWVGRKPAGLFLQLTYTRTGVWEFFWWGQNNSNKYYACYNGVNLHFAWFPSSASI